MDSKTLARCGLIWLVLLLFAIDGSNLIRADVQELPAEKINDEEIDSLSLEAGHPDSESHDLKPEPCPYPVTNHSPNWFVAEQAFSDETGLLDVKTERSCLNLEQAEEELWRACVKQINPILERWYGRGAIGHVNLTPDYVRNNLIHDNMIEFQKVGLAEPVDDVSNFYVAFGRFELDQNFRQYVKSRLQDSRTRRRLAGTGLLGGTLLSLLAVSLGYLRLETATRGFYSRRLQTVALLIVVSVIAFAFVLAQKLFV